MACQWNISSPTGPAEQFAGGSFPKSISSLLGIYNVNDQHLLLLCRMGSDGYDAVFLQ